MDHLHHRCKSSPVVTESESVTFVQKIYQLGWDVCHYSMLPDWLQDNEYLVHGHRPPLPSFGKCFKSIFKIHTETVNIWTHLLGCVGFICIALCFYTHPSIQIDYQEKILFGIFLTGAIACLGFSFMFHTVCCHSPFVSKLFSKLDYCGISLLITSSGIPWLYYAFYCHMQPKRIYLTAICILGIATVLVTMIDSFSTPQWRPYRAGLFAVFGLGGIVPALHHLLLEETLHISMRSFGWLSLMGALYIVGALLYVLRIPERFFPGKFDIWLHSHQLFHVLVIAAALVHLYGILELAFHRLSNTKCITDFVL